MKKAIYVLLSVLLTASLISWNWTKTQHPAVEKAEVIECLNMETQQTYKLEASTPAFAAMHPSPIVVNPENLLGKMMSFDAADGSKPMLILLLLKRKPINI